jgi:putative oxidoreductase
MKLGLTLFRAVLGATMFAHGAQKLFGWFGGHGPEATGQAFEGIGLKPGKRAALIAVRIPGGVKDVEEYLLSGIDPADVRWLDAGE